MIKYKKTEIKSQQDDYLTNNLAISLADNMLKLIARFYYGCFVNLISSQINNKY